MEAGLLLPFACLFHAPPLPCSSTAILLHCHAPPLPCSTAMLLHCHAPLSTLCATPHSFLLHPSLCPCVLPAPPSRPSTARRHQSGGGAAGAAHPFQQLQCTIIADTAAANAADATLGVPIPNVLIPSLVRLARVGLASTAMPASTRPSLGRVLAELEIVRDDVATALRRMEEKVEKKEGELQGGRVAVAGNRGNEHLDSLGNPSLADPSSTSPNPSNAPSQLPPPPPSPRRRCCASR
ncbi:unnamed protein product [Closterium sp. Naga37s-1]|nr:unnamed protein product [Closterium sp. Naga37s-1]